MFPGFLVRTLPFCQGFLQSHQGFSASSSLPTTLPELSSTALDLICSRFSSHTP